MSGRSRVALRLALRMSRRSLGRSALIAVMVALPVAGMTTIAVVFDSTRATSEERATTELGATEAQLRLASAPSSTLVQDPLSHSWEDPYPQYGDLADLGDVLPEGTRVLALSTGRISVTTATGVATVPVREGPSWDPAFAGHFDVVAGRTPRGDDEVMVTASLLPRLRVDVGDTVAVRSPIPATVTIVGVLDDASIADSEPWFFANDGALTGALVRANPGEATYYLPDTRLDWDAVRDLNRDGITAVSRAVLLDPPSVPTTNDSSTLVAIIATTAVLGGFAAFEVILLAGAAFAVTARQQQRTLATVASVGAPRGLLFAVLAANGAVLGVIGGVIGAGVGLIGSVAFMAITNDGSATLYFGFHVPWLALIGFVIFAVVTGWMAALVPARAASRFDVVAALRGSRKPPQLSTRRPVIGVGLAVVGVAAAIVGGASFAILLVAGQGIEGGHPLIWVPVVLLIAGPIAAQIGLALCGPLLLHAVARLASRAGVGVRLAARDAARNPARAVPALAAIMTTVFVATLAMCLVFAGQENSRLEHQYHFQPGQVGVALTHFAYDATLGTTPISHYESTAAVIAAIRRAVDVDEVRVISEVPDPIFELADKDDDLPPLAVPVIAPANLCPSYPGSADYDESVDDPGSPKAIAAMTDWRCQSPFTAQTNLTEGHIQVGDVNDLALVLGRRPSAEAVRALAHGEAVSLYREYVDHGQVTIQWWSAQDAESAVYGQPSGAPVRAESLPAVLDLPQHPVSFGIFVSPGTADRLGLEYEPMLVLASTTHPPTTEQRDALDAEILDLPGNLPGTVFAQVEFGPPRYANDWAWGLLALAALISVASATVAIGLARFDGRQDDQTLASLGAGRRVRREFAFWQALIICGLGTALGAAMGLVPALALSADPRWPFVPPWLQIALAVVVLPLAIAAGSWLVAGRGRVAGRRVSIA